MSQHPHTSTHQGRETHAPATTWSPAAEESIHAADIAGARGGVDATSTIAGPQAEQWNAFDRSIGIRERRSVLLAQVVEDCARRLDAWASSLSDASERRTATQAAAVIRQGR